MITVLAVMRIADASQSGQLRALHRDSTSHHGQVQCLIAYAVSRSCDQRAGVQLGETYSRLADTYTARSRSSLWMQLTRHQLGAVLATDLLITIIIATGLRRIKTGWSHTDSILRRLVM
jgi:hypothetical protein